MIDKWGKGRGRSRKREIGHGWVMWIGAHGGGIEAHGCGWIGAHGGGIEAHGGGIGALGCGSISPVLGC